jgi:hypothetical protein
MLVRSLSGHPAPAGSRLVFGRAQLDLGPREHLFLAVLEQFVSRAAAAADDQS